MSSVLQDWVCNLSFMQQTVLLTAIRGPDGLPKYHVTKYLLRWFRRCVLFSAFEGAVINNPVDATGGSFTGPSVEYPIICTVSDGMGKIINVERHNTIPWQDLMVKHVDQYLKELDAVPHHFQMHFMHAAQIVGYKHPDQSIRTWWKDLYVRLVHDMHLYPETEEEMDKRLGDNRDGWLKRADDATKE